MKRFVYDAVPVHVIEYVVRHLNALREAERAMQHGRNADRQFGGGGRYEAETWAYRYAEAVARAEAGLGAFEKLAEKNGVVAADVYEQLGGRAKVELSPAGAAYYADMV